MSRWWRGGTRAKLNKEAYIQPDGEGVLPWYGVDTDGTVGLVAYLVEGLPLSIDRAQHDPRGGHGPFDVSTKGHGVRVAAHGRRDCEECAAEALEYAICRTKHNVDNKEAQEQETTRHLERSRTRKQGVSEDRCWSRGAEPNDMKMVSVHIQLGCW